MEDESLPSFFLDRKQRVDDMLDELLPPSDDNRLADSMRYSVLGGGKRVRGVLVLETSRINQNRDDTLSDRLSGIVELLHTYTLVHDDLPVMDDDDLRRGQAACHVEYDEATALLSGNALLSLAFETIGNLRVPEEDLSWLLTRTGAVMGYDGILDGQYRDLDLEGTEPSEETILEMYEKKTGYLLGLALEMGALAGDLGCNDREKLGGIGRTLGVGFQIHDDLLERSEENDKLGKDSESDLRKDKSTLVELIGEQAARERANQYVRKGQNQLRQFPYETERLVELADYLIERNY